MDNRIVSVYLLKNRPDEYLHTFINQRAFTGNHTLVLTESFVNSDNVGGLYATYGGVGADLAELCTSLLIPGGKSISKIYLDTDDKNPFLDVAKWMADKYTCEIEIVRSVDSPLTDEFYTMWEAIGKPVVNSPYIEDRLVYNNAPRGTDMLAEGLIAMPRADVVEEDTWLRRGVFYNEIDDDVFAEYAPEHDFVVTANDTSHKKYIELYGSGGIPAFSLETLPYIGATDLYMFRLYPITIEFSSSKTKLHVCDYLNFPSTAALQRAFGYYQDGEISFEAIK